MTPETALQLAGARKFLQTARDLIKDGYANDAGRNAYLAAFHAAQAYIVEHAGRAAKTHAGAHSQFAQLAMHEDKIGKEMSSFLPRAFRLKAIVDYELGAGSDIPAERAANVVEKAGHFVECIAGLLENPDAKATDRKPADKRKE